MWSLPPFHANVHTNIWVDVTDKPKMLVLDVASVDDPPGGPGYQNWTVAFCGQGLACSIVVDPQPGLFTIRIPGFANGSRGALALYHYGIDVGYDRIAMMERPANAVYVDTSSTDGMVRPGDRVNVVVELSAPCEEISAQLLHNPARGWMYAFPVNGSNDLVMKKADDEGRRWITQFTVEDTGSAQARRVYVKVRTLGGGLNRPLWGNFTEGFDGTAAR